MLNSLDLRALRSVFGNMRRTALVVVSLMAGVFALGVVLHMQRLIDDSARTSYSMSNRAHLSFTLEQLADVQLAGALAKEPSVAAVQLSRRVPASFQLGERDRQHAISLYSVPDFEDIRVNRLTPETVFEPDPDAWPAPDVYPPRNDGILLERTSLLLATLGFGRNARQNDTILLELPTGVSRTLTLDGLVYDPSRLPATYLGRAYGFVSAATLAEMGLPPGYNEVHIRLNDQGRDVMARGNQLWQKIEAGGYRISGMSTIGEGQLPLSWQFEGIQTLLAIVGGLLLVVGAVLVFNTMSAAMMHEQQQIGTLKAIGIGGRAIAWHYLKHAALYGLIALPVAVPLAAVAAVDFLNWLAYFINFQKAPVEISPGVALVQTLAAMAVPVAAAASPVIASVRMTAKEAMESVGLSPQTSLAQRIERVLDALRPLPGLVLFGVRNAFRRLDRLVLGTFTLAMAGGCLIGVLNLRASLERTLDEMVSFWGYDGQIQFAVPQPAAELTRTALAQPGVSHAEAWSNTNAFWVRDGALASDSIIMIGLPQETQLLHPVLVAGRWLAADDTNAMVVAAPLLDRMPVGTEVNLRVRGQMNHFKVVGAIQVAQPMQLAYLSFDHLQLVTGEPGMAGGVYFKRGATSPQPARSLADALRGKYESDGRPIAAVEITEDIAMGTRTLFYFLVVLMLLLVALFAMVGVLGLTGIVELNVVERTREVGVMRALGGSQYNVVAAFLSESMVVGLASWLVGVLISIPLGAALRRLVGDALVRAELAPVFEPLAPLVWLVIVIALTVLATWQPSMRAARDSVARTLRYA
jgi:putative ABC transport system permease protein